MHATTPPASYVPIALLHNAYAISNYMAVRRERCRIALPRRMKRISHSLGVQGGNAVAERIADYVNAHRSEYAYIATTQDWHIEPGTHWSEHPDFVDTWPVHGKAGTANAELHPAIAALNIEHHFKKDQYSPSYSGFEGFEDNTDRIPTREEVSTAMAAGKTLANGLKTAGITRVDVVGLAESHCVKETALDAKKLGFEVHVIENLTEPVSEELGIAARRQMSEANIILD